MFAVTATRIQRLTNPVRQPAVKERLIGRPALGEAEVAFALERLERAQQHGLAAAVRPARPGEEGVERGERRRADAAVGDQVGIILAAAVERGQRALEEGDGDRRPMLTPVSNSSAARRALRFAISSKRGRSQ